MRSMNEFEEERALIRRMEFWHEQFRTRLIDHVRRMADAQVTLALLRATRRSKTKSRRRGR